MSDTYHRDIYFPSVIFVSSSDRYQLFSILM